MSKHHFGRSGNRIVRQSPAGSDHVAHVVAYDRAAGGLNPVEREAGLPQCASPVARTVAADQSSGCSLEAVLAASLEGIAIYGVSMHPAAALPVHEILVSAKSHRGHAGLDQGPMAAESAPGTSSEDGNAVTLEQPMWAGTARPRHWTWLRSLSAMMMALWSYWCREREIRQAAASLCECDDRTLRDMGIARSDIEQVMRRSRDY